jgi:hypothetical protein
LLYDTSWIFGEFLLYRTSYGNFDKRAIRLSKVGFETCQFGTTLANIISYNYLIILVITGLA